MMFGFNNFAPILLKVLDFNPSDIPRFRDCFIKDNTICIHTRTGGGNREFYDNLEGCQSNYPEYFTGSDTPAAGPWNDDLRKHPNYLTDCDDDFDCTYANFFFSFPEEFKTELQALSSDNKSLIPSEKWKKLFEEVKNE